MFGRYPKMKKIQNYMIPLVFDTNLGIELNFENKVCICRCKSVEELETQLNALCEYVFGKTRRVRYYPSGDTIYIDHLINEEFVEANSAPLICDCTVREYWFMWVIHQFLRHKNGEFEFLDVHWLMLNSTKSKASADYPLTQLYVRSLFK